MKESLDPRYVQLQEYFRQIQERMADPSLDQRSKSYFQTVRYYKKHEPVVKKIEELKAILSELEGLRRPRDR